MQPRLVFFFRFSVQSLFLLWILLLNFDPCLAQSFIRDSISGWEYAEIAKARYHEVDTSIYYSELALDKLRSTHQWEQYIATLCGLSYCYNVKEYYRKMEANNILAFQMAQEHLTFDHPLYIFALNNLAIIHDVVYEDHKTSLRLYREALELAKQYQKNTSFEAGILENIGQQYHELGDLEITIDYYQQALNTYQDLADLPSFKIAKLHAKIAQVKADQQDLVAALYQQQQALDLVDTMKIIDPSFKIRFLTILAHLQLQNGQANSALQTIQKVGRGLSPLQKASALHINGDILDVLGRFTEAQQLYRQALAILPKNEKILEAEIQLSLANSLGPSQHQKALYTYQKAINALFKEGTSFNKHGLPAATIPPLSRVLLSRVLRNQAQLLQQKNDLYHLRQALATYHFLGIQTDQARANYQSQESRLLLAENTKLDSEDAIEVAYRLYTITKKQAYLQDAFLFAEKGKANMLLDELNWKAFKGKKSATRAIMDREYELKIAINKLERKKEYITDHPSLREIEIQIFELKDALLNHHEVTRIANPIYASLQEPITLEEIQSQLIQKDQVLIEYFIGRHWIYSFVFEQDDFRVHRSPNISSFVNDLKVMLDNRQMTGKHGVAQFSKAAYGLYQSLIAPLDLSDEVKSVIIIPDEELAYLPFDMLLDQQQEIDLPGNLPYLLHRYTFSYAYSASVLQQQNKHRASKSRILGVYPIFANSDRYLSASETEYRYLKQYAGKHLLAEEASLDNFLQLLGGDFQIFHFSTHARAQDEHTQEPAIDFFDASLYLSDLTARKLEANLVVLSACETGLGKLRTGEGVMSLSRGFTYAGIPSVISSLWAVPEQSTSELMQAFYENLADGLPKDEALRAAKLYYLQHCSDAEAAPYFWGALVPIGNSQPLELVMADSISSIWWLAIGGIAGIFFWLVSRKRNT